MLSSMPSRLLTEWQAYEQYAGPLGPQYRDDLLRAQMEWLRVIAYAQSEDEIPDRPVFPTAPEWVNQRPPEAVIDLTPEEVEE